MLELRVNGASYIAMFYSLILRRGVFLLMNVLNVFMLYYVSMICYQARPNNPVFKELSTLPQSSVNLHLTLTIKHSCVARSSAVYRLT